MATEITRVFEFGPFRLDEAECQLFRDGQLIPIPPKVFDTLILLIEHRGHLVGKDELMSRLWPDSFVQEVSLNRSISTLRKALGERTAAPIYVETVPKRGYRFIGPVVELTRADELFVERRRSVEIITEEVEEIVSPFSQSLLEVSSPPTGLQQIVQQPNMSAVSRPEWKTWRNVLIGGAALVIVAVFFYLRTSNQGGRAPTRTPMKSIAVLPFKDFGASSDEDRLGPALADVLVTRLSVLKGVNVRPVSAALKFDGQDSLTAGRRLEVDAVLEGSIHRLNGRVRVTARLVAVSDRAIIWGGQFDEQPKDLFAIQDGISRQVARALVARMSDLEERMLAKRPTENIEAHQHYMKGRYFWNKRTTTDAEKAVRHFEQAIEIDPNYALAYSGLADCYTLRTALPPADAMPKAKAAALEALKLDDMLAESHASLALVKGLYDFDQAGMEQELKRAIELNPSYALAHGWYAMHLTKMGRFPEGAEAARRAQELDPTSPSLHIYAAWNYYHSRQFDRSVEEVRRAVELDPNARTCGLAARAYALKGMYEEAVVEGLKSRSVPANDACALGALGYVYAVAGRQKEARLLLAELKGLAAKSHVTPFYMALVHTGLGEKDHALRYLAECYRKPDDWLFMLKVDPAFDSLRADPRFLDLVARLGFRKV
jgi:DNA-binding winged helix-turn-helix (wHTH) protein/TolB-like protein/tetratricopeptide (TPR) repeat protein